MSGSDYNYIVEVRDVINVSSGECFVFKQRILRSSLMPGRDYNFIVEVRGVINVSSGECFVFKQRI